MGNYTWLNHSEARRRLQELEHERQLLLHILGGETAAPAQQKSGNGVRRRRRRGGPTLISLIVGELQRHRGTGTTVSDIIAGLRKGQHAALVEAKNASAQVSAAISQHLRGKKPAIKVTRRGKPGKPSTYELA